jgi:hypothetical protein
MPNDENDLLLAAGGKVLVAPVGTASPADLTVAWAAAWIEVGYIDENGVTLDPGMTLAEFNSWQSDYPTRRQGTGRTMQVNFNMQQWSRENVKLAFGGGAFTVPSAGVYKYEPPDVSEMYEKALGVEWDDGTKRYRWTFKRGMNVDLGTIQGTRTGLALLPVSFGVLASSGVKPWQFLTNDPEFVNP